MGIADVRALREVLESGNTEMAGLIVLEPLNARKRNSFEGTMAQAGDLEVRGIRYQRMQLLTVDEIMEGKRFATPAVVGRTEPQPVLPYG